MSCVSDVGKVDEVGAVVDGVELSPGGVAGDQNHEYVPQEDTSTSHREQPAVAQCHQPGGEDQEQRGN